MQKVVMIPGKQKIQFHVGKIGHGCKFSDTVLPMAYLAWRDGHAFDLLSRYPGINARQITANMNSFCDWIASTVSGFPPILLLAHIIISLHGRPVAPSAL